MGSISSHGEEGDKRDVHHVEKLQKSDHSAEWSRGGLHPESPELVNLGRSKFRSLGSI